MKFDDIDFNSLSKMSDKDLTELFGVRDFFIYELDFGEITAGNSGQASFNVQADSNFLWQEGAQFTDVSAAAQEEATRVLPLATCVIQDQSSGRQLSSNPVPIPSQFGSGERPFILPSPRFFRANTQVVVSVTNYSADQDYTIKLQFIGTKFFKFAQQF